MPVSVIKQFCSLPDESSPPEDEGISSSERSLSPEGDPQRESMVYEVFNVKNETYDLMRNKRPLHKKLESTKKINDFKKSSDDEDETTIDEVIQELRNIVNHAETEQYNKEDIYTDERSSRCNQTSEINVSVKTLECQKHRDVEKEDSITSTRHSIQITSSGEFAQESNDDEESEIVPSKILPHPPRKAKSLIHLFNPPVDQGLLYKPPDLYDDTFYSSDEGSDSLLSASRCQNQVTKKPSGSSFDFHECRALFNSMAEKDKVDGGRGKRPRTRSREESRKASIKRSESFQTSEKGSRQREYIDSMFYNENHASIIGSAPLQRSNSKCSRVDEIVNLIESKKLTKSLDRIDEGLNSMVDIVMLAEPKKPSWPYERRQRSCSRTSSDAGKETPLVPVTRSNSRLNGFHQKFDTRSSSNKGKEELSKTDSPQKFFLPHPKLSTGSFDNNASFLMKRGHSNAGFYSGTHMLRDAPASMTSLVMTGTHSHADLKRTLSPMGSSNTFGLHKVTDMPSGLY